jgi:hypothetical protein
LKSIKIIKKWASLRSPDPRFAKTAIGLYKTLPKRDKIEMVKEFTDYIEAVKNGEVIAGPMNIPKNI